MWRPQRPSSVKQSWAWSHHHALFVQGWLEVGYSWGHFWASHQRWLVKIPHTRSSSRALAPGRNVSVPFYFIPSRLSMLKTPPSPRFHIFVLLCSLHLNMKAQLLVTISTHPFKDGPIFHYTHTCNGHTPTKHPTNCTHKHNIKHAARMPSNAYFKLTWIVGKFFCG